LISNHPQHQQPWVLFFNSTTQKIILSDDIPLKSQAYRVSLLKKQVIEEQVDQMLRDPDTEPRQTRPTCRNPNTMPHIWNKAHRQDKTGVSELCHKTKKQT